MAKSNYQSWIFLGTALVAGAGAFWLSHVYLKHQEDKIRIEAGSSQKGSVQVVVASHNLDAGSIIGANTMSIGRLPADYVTQRFVTVPRYAALAGHALLRAKAKGEPLLLDDVGGAYVERFSDLLKPGERAISLQATELNSNSGLLLPGDYVDLFVMTKATGSDQNARTLLPVLERVHVLAAGSSYLRAEDQKYETLNERNSRYDTVTVAVSVSGAEKLVLAQKMGDMAYLLRNSLDNAENVAARMTSAQLGVGAPESPSASGGTYEYFSMSNPNGVTRQVSMSSPLSVNEEPNPSEPAPAAPVSTELPPAFGSEPTAAPAADDKDGHGAQQAPAATTSGPTRE